MATALQVRTHRGFRHRANGAQRSTGRRRGAEERQDLDQDHDDADSGHETGDDDVRRVRHETADPRQAQEHLEQTAQHDDGQRLGEVGCMGRENDRHGNGHRRRGPRDLDLVPPNTAAKKPTAIAPWRPATAPMPEATPSARSNGESNDRGRQRSEQVATEGRDVVLHVLEALRPTLRSLFFALPCASFRGPSFYQ